MSGENACSSYLILRRFASGRIQRLGGIALRHLGDITGKQGASHSAVSGRLPEPAGPAGARARGPGLVDGLRNGDVPIEPWRPQLPEAGTDSLRDIPPPPEVRRLLLLGSHPAAGAPLGRPYALALQRGTARPRQSSKHPSGTDRPRHFSLVRCKLPAWPADQRGDALDVGGGCEGAGVNTEPKPSVLQAGSGSLQAFEPGVRTAS